MSDDELRPAEHGYVDPPVPELARWQGVDPVTDIAALAHPEAWESEDEFRDFLADLYASRRSDAS